MSFSTKGATTWRDGGDCEKSTWGKKVWETGIFWKLQWVEGKFYFWHNRKEGAWKSVCEKYLRKSQISPHHPLTWPSEGQRRWPPTIFTGLILDVRCLLCFSGEQGIEDRKKFEEQWRDCLGSLIPSEQNCELRCWCRNLLQQFTIILYFCL